MRGQEADKARIGDQQQITFSSVPFPSSLCGSVTSVASFLPFSAPERIVEKSKVLGARGVSPSQLFYTRGRFLPICRGFLPQPGPLDFAQRSLNHGQVTPEQVATVGMWEGWEGWFFVDREAI